MPVKEPLEVLFTFEDYEVDSDQLELRRAGVVQPVEPQVFSLLELLVANAHRVVSKDEINEAVWAGRIVSEAALSSRIRSVRRAIGDDGKAQRLIRTVRDRGFRFVGSVEISGAVPVASWTDGERPSVGGATPEPEATTPDAQSSIAVLPLQPLTEDPRMAPLADAISHELITELSRLRWLRVIARGSSFRFRGQDVDLAQVGRILGVRYVLCGSFAVFGSDCVITLELARPQEGSVVWAERIETTASELMSLRVEISARVAASIEGEILTREARRASSLSTENLDSWSAYFRGLWHVNRFNAHDNEIAGHLFGRAVSLDPGFARAHAGLSFVHFQNAFVGYARNRSQSVELARQHALRGHELDSTDPFINLTMGRTEILRGRWQDAAPWFDRTTDLNSNYALAYYHRALADAVSGDGRQGPELAMQAISLSPVDPLRYAMIASRCLSHLNQSEYGEAVVWGERAAREPNAHVLIWTIAAMANELAGHRDEAEAWADRIRAKDPRLTQARFFQSFPFARTTLRAEAGRALTSLGI